MSQLLWPGGDSGWVLLALNSGWSTSSFGPDPFGNFDKPLAVRRLDRTVHIRGSLAKASYAQYEAIATLPVEFRPTHVVQIPARVPGAAAAALVEVGSSGALRTSTGGSTWLMFEGSWLLG